MEEITLSIDDYKKLLDEKNSVIEKLTRDNNILLDLLTFSEKKPETIKNSNTFYPDSVLNTQTRVIFDSMLEGVAILDYNWTYLYTNQSNANFVGSSVEQMIGKTLFDIVPGILNTSFMDAYRVCMEQRIPQYVESSFVFSKGKKRWFESRVVPIPEGIFLHFIDSTTRKNHELHLEGEKNIYQRVLEASASGIVVMDKLGQRLMSNAAYEKIWQGLKYDSATDHIHYTAWFADSGKKIEPHEWASAKAMRGITTLREELVIQCFDGTIKNIFNSAVPVFSKDGEVEAIIIILVDITELKNKEKELLNAQDSLNLVLEEKEKLLKEINHALKTKEMLLMEIHHRVKNNMQVMQSLLSIQSSYFKDADVLDAFECSISRIKTMAIVHEQLYSTKKLSSIRLDKYLKTLVEKLRVSYSSLGIVVEINVITKNIVISIDAALNMGLIINELILNSVKHAFPNRRGGRIMVCLEKHADNIFISVADNGVGIPEGVDLRNKDSFGMELVHNLLETYDCKLEVESTEGTTFKMTLPMCRAIEDIVEVKD